MVVIPSITWLFVIIYPSSDIIMPDPTEEDEKFAVLWQVTPTTDARTFSDICFTVSAPSVVFAPSDFGDSFIVR